MTTTSLVIAPQWIGDAVMAEPMLARLAESGDRPVVAALPWVAPVLRAMPSVADVVDLPFAHGRLDWTARRDCARRLRGQFGVAYVLPNSLKSALVPWLAAIPRRVGYHGEGRWGLLTERLANPVGRPAMVARYGALVGGVSPGARPRLQVGSVAVEAVLRATGLQEGHYRVFAPGAEYGPSKRWPSAHFAALARQLHAADGQPVVLLGSAHDRPVCQEIAALAPGATRMLAGETTLDAAIALVSAASAMVSNDSGLMHVAAALDVPQVAFFGSTSPLHTPPSNPRAAVLWLHGRPDLACIPCFERTCRYGHHKCLVDIAPEAAADALLSTTRPNA